MNQDKFTVTEHLEELRGRIIISLAALAVCAAASFANMRGIWAVLAAPVGKLIFLKPAEALVTDIKLSFFSGLLLAMPVILYQAWAFISPALLDIERKYAGFMAFVSYLLFAGGIAFSFFGVMPVGIKFLLNYSGGMIEPTIAVSAYISFVMAFVLAFGLIFQFPLIVLLLAKAGIVTPAWLASKRRHVILVIFIAAAILTPGPDIFSQFLMALPTYVLFEISVVLARIFVKNGNKSEVAAVKSGKGRQSGK